MKNKNAVASVVIVLAVAAAIVALLTIYSAWSDYVNRKAQEGNPYAIADARIYESYPDYIVSFVLWDADIYPRVLVKNVKVFVATSGIERTEAFFYGMKARHPFRLDSHSFVAEKVEIFVRSQEAKEQWDKQLDCERQQQMEDVPLDSNFTCD